MVRRGYLGNFELMVLLAVIRLQESAYGVTISRELERTTRRSVGLASVYNALERLESKGLVSSRLGDPTPERGGRAKRYFRVMGKGVREVKTARDALTALWEDLPAGGPA